MRLEPVQTFLNSDGLWARYSIEDFWDLIQIGQHDSYIEFSSEDVEPLVKFLERFLKDLESDKTQKEEDTAPF